MEKAEWLNKVRVVLILFFMGRRMGFAPLSRPSHTSNLGPSLVPSAFCGRILKDLTLEEGLGSPMTCLLSFLPDCGPSLALLGPVYGEAFG